MKPALLFQASTRFALPDHVVGHVVPEPLSTFRVLDRCKSNVSCAIGIVYRDVVFDVSNFDRFR
jgi:hypothetical protein